MIMYSASINAGILPRWFRFPSEIEITQVDARIAHSCRTQLSFRTEEIVTQKKLSGDAFYQRLPPG